MLSEFIQEKMDAARYKILKDGTYFGEVPGADGVWANSSSLEECKDELYEVLEGWILLKIRDREVVSGVKVGAMRNRDL